MTQPNLLPCPTIEPGAFAPMPLGEAYSAFPTLAPIPGGLRMVWWQGTDHLSYGTSQLYTATSVDDGVTWTVPLGLRWSVGVRDPALSMQAPDRHWLTYFTGFRQNPALGAYARLSRDGGATWGTPRRVDPRLPFAACSAPVRAEGPTAVSPLWMPFYGRTHDEEGQLEPADSAYVGRSLDGGANWTTRRIADGATDGRGYAEPWLLLDENEPARLLVIHRFGAWNDIGLTESLDGGATWTEPRPLFPGTGRPAAVRLSTGQLVVVYRSVQDRSAVYAVSQDGGETWVAERTLVPNHNNTALGMCYAAPVEIDRGRVYVVVAMEDSSLRSRLWHGHLTCS